MAGNKKHLYWETCQIKGSQIFMGLFSGPFDHIAYDNLVCNKAELI